jgi:Rrf2 family protein
MKLTKSADFALRIVIYLASPQGKGATMPLLAERLSIPYNNLSKLVQLLAKAQVLQTRQGKNGGVSLMRRPDQISLKTVIDVIDGPTRLTECLVNKDFCSLNDMCQLKNVLGDVQRQIDSILEKKKISSFAIGQSR